MGLDSDDSNDMWNDTSDNQGDLQYDFTNQLKLQSATSRSANSGGGGGGDASGGNRNDDDEEDDDDDVQRSNYKNLASQLLWSNPSVADLSSVDPWGSSGAGVDAWASFSSGAADAFADFDAHFSDFSGTPPGVATTEPEAKSESSTTATETDAQSPFNTNPFTSAQDFAAGDPFFFDATPAAATTTESSRPDATVPIGAGDDSFTDANELNDDQNVPNLSLEDSHDEIIT